MSREPHGGLGRRCDHADRGETPHAGAGAALVTSLLLPLGIDRKSSLNFGCITSSDKYESRTARVGRLARATH